MDTVQRDLKVLGDTAAELLEKSSQKQLQKIIAQLGVDISKAEQADLLKKAADVFRRKCEEKMTKLVEDCQLKEKMGELADLVTKSEEINAELGITSGYRPKGYQWDIVGPLKKTSDAHKACVIEELDDFDEQIKEKQRELSARRVEIRQLDKEIEEKISFQKSQAK